jgi:hypothetical protein
MVPNSNHSPNVENKKSDLFFPNLTIIFRKNENMATDIRIFFFIFLVLAKFLTIKMMLPTPKIKEKKRKENREGKKEHSLRARERESGL